MKQQKPHKEDNALKTAASFTGIAFQMGITIYLGNLLGAWLDEKFDKTFLEDTVTLLAVFLAMYVIIRKVMSLNK